MLLFIKAAGINKVMLFCDQLEDFASPQTPKRTRSIEVERFRDFIAELLPMADMVSVVVTMHPRALASIEEFWQLADLPSIRIEEANRHIVVVMPPLATLDQAKRLLTAYLAAARRDTAAARDALAPFTEDAGRGAVGTLDEEASRSAPQGPQDGHLRCGGKPRHDRRRYGRLTPHATHGGRRRGHY